MPARYDPAISRPGLTHRHALLLQGDLETMALLSPTPATALSLSATEEEEEADTEPRRNMAGVTIGGEARWLRAGRAVHNAKESASPPTRVLVPPPYFCAGGGGLPIEREKKAG